MVTVGDIIWPVMVTVGRCCIRDNGIWKSWTGATVEKINHGKPRSVKETTPIAKIIYKFVCLFHQTVHSNRTIIIRKCQRNYLNYGSYP